MSRDYALLVTSPERQQRVEQLLAAQELTVSTATDGAEALRIVHENGPPALIVTELELPRMDGIKLLEALRELSVSAPAIAISSFLELRNTMSKLSVKLGVTSVLSPNVTLSSMSRRIAKAREPKRRRHTPPA